MPTPCQVLCVSSREPDLITSAFGPFVVHHCAELAEAERSFQSQACDVLMVDLTAVGGADRFAQWPGLSRAVLDTALVVVAPEPTVADCSRLIGLGVREVLSTADVSGGSLGRFLRLAFERRQLDEAARRAYTIDLSTGLPNHHQLLEHMHHLLALREREPAHMALIVLQLDGLRGVEAALGAEAAQVVRRKAAVRLRASLRASDVVASLGRDTFAVLLAWMDAGDDADRVARKLLASVGQPLSVAGQAMPLGARVGVAQYPVHGKDARELLERASSQASGQGMTRHLGLGAAANDELPPTRA